MTSHETQEYLLFLWYIRASCARCLSHTAISYPEPAIFRGRIESSGIIHNRKPEILFFLLDCYIPFCINNQSDSPGFMDYPRALDSSPEDRGLGVRDWPYGWSPLFPSPRGSYTSADTWGESSALIGGWWIFIYSCSARLLNSKSIFKWTLKSPNIFIRW